MLRNCFSWKKFEETYLLNVNVILKRILQFKLELNADYGRFGRKSEVKCIAFSKDLMGMLQLI